MNNIATKKHFIKLGKKGEDLQGLIESIASSYSLAYQVNMSDDSFKIIRMDEKIVGYGEVFKNFSEAKEFFFDDVLHPADREKIIRELDYDHIRKRLSETKSYNVEYRALIDGTTVWHDMNITSFHGDIIGVGFTPNDEEISKRHLSDKHNEEYIALFIIDLDTERIKAGKTSPLFKTEEVGKSVPYEPAMKSFAATYEGEAKEFFERISDIDYIRKEFAVDNKRTFSYKATKMADEKWIDVTTYVIERHPDGTPSMLTLGFSIVDTLASASRELNSRMKSDMQMIRGLASEYHALYYFNIDENTFKVYTIDEVRFPEAKLFLAGNVTPSDIFWKFGNSDLVHPDDRHLFTNLNIELIREKLSDKKKLTYRFRRKFGNEYLWTDMEFIKFEDVGERANAVALGFAERDTEIRSEQTLKRCFEILSKESTPAESIAELMSLAGEYYGGNRAYIFEYGENGQVITNTYEWCREGVKPMISELQNVPSSEVDGWIKEFERHGAFYMSSLDADNAYSTPEGRAMLEMQGIESLITAPLLSGGEIAGFIGVDDPTKAKHNTEVLKNIAAVAYSEILKRNQHDEEHVTLERLADTFVSVYYTDLSRDYMHNWKIDSEYKDVYGSVQYYSVSMGGYVRNYIAERDRERCILMTSPEYVLEQFKTKDRFSIEMTDIMLGYERNVVFDYVKVSEDGSKFVACCKDVTESIAKEKAQQKKIQDAYEAAEVANKSKSSFLFNMSHDIRTPMNAITGFTTMAKKYLDDKEKVADYLDKIDLSSQQLLMLINQVLEMSRIESGKIEFNNAPVNVKDNYEALITILSEQAKEKGLDFHHSFTDVKHFNVLADEARMSQITLNITGNAIKYTPEGGRIDFHFRENPKAPEGYASYTFSVIDTGIGMSEEFQKVLFEPFSREKNSTVSKIQGTGLGMSIVKSLVDLLGGTIEVQSELGKGSRFDVTVALKLDEEKEKDVARLSSPGAIHDFKGCRVLLVEDNELNREIAKFILEEKGLIVEEAEDGDVAVQKVRDIAAKGEYGYYDFILMDVQMPHMNGYEATGKIREIFAPTGIHIPIIAISANAFEEDKAMSRGAGMDEHIAKPIDVVQLWATLAKYIK